VRDNSPDKNDFKDPSVIADLVWNGCYNEIVSLSGTYAELRAASTEWAALAKMRTAVRNGIQGLLEVWFPEITEIYKDAVCKSVRGIIRKYPTVKALARARLSSVESALKKATSGRGGRKAESILSAAKNSVAPECGQLARSKALIGKLDLLETIQKRQECLLNEIKQYLTELPESQYMMSIPGIGPITVGGLLGECGNIGKFKTYEQLEKFLGLNLYEVSSGNHKGKRHISKRGRALARYLICHIALMMTKSGCIFASEAEEMRGRGKKTGNLTLNRATQTVRQPGSSIKPLSAYAPAIEYNLISYGSKAVDSPLSTVINGKSVKWPKNYGGTFSGNTSIAVALMLSLNTVPVKLVDKMTPRKSFDFLTQKLGITTYVSDKRDSKGNILSDINLSALGVGGCTYGVTVKEMTAAYATFGNLGTYWKPTTFTLVTDQKNEVVLKQEEKGKKAMGEDTSNIMNKLLQNVVSGSVGIAKGAAFGNYPIFAKTGTTTDNKDRWFAGGTPYYVAASWYGFDQPKDLGALSSNPAQKVWKACMIAIHKNLKVKDFPQSEKVVYRRYCTYTGKIATYNCSSTALGWFKADDHSTCSVHGGKAMAILKKPAGISASNGGGTYTTVKQTTKSTAKTTGKVTASKTEAPTQSNTKPWDPTTTVTATATDTATVTDTQATTLP